MERPSVQLSVESLAKVDVADIPYETACVAIQGVVSPSVQAGCDGRCDDYKVHLFTLAAWRRLGGPIVERDLTILRPMPPDGEWLGEIPSYSTLQISVLLSTDGTRAVFERLQEMDLPDPDLNAIASELQKPVVISTSRFGNLTLNRYIGWFEGEGTWNGQTVRVMLPVGDVGAIEHALDAADALWADQRIWKKRIRDRALADLLPLKNDSWLEEGESALSADQFIQRMKLESIQVNSDGEFSFWHNDGDLFWGHSIEVTGNVKDGPAGAHIQG